MKKITMATQKIFFCTLILNFSLGLRAQDESKNEETLPTSHSAGSETPIRKKTLSRTILEWQERVHQAEKVKKEEKDKEMERRSRSHSFMLEKKNSRPLIREHSKSVSQDGSPAFKVTTPRISDIHSHSLGDESHISSCSSDSSEHSSAVKDLHAQVNSLLKIIDHMRMTHEEQMGLKNLFIEQLQKELLVAHSLIADQKKLAPLKKQSSRKGLHLEDFNSSRFLQDETEVKINKKRSTSKGQYSRRSSVMFTLPTKEKIEDNGNKRPAPLSARSKTPREEISSPRSDGQNDKTERHQRKGIFSELTAATFEELKQELLAGPVDMRQHKKSIMAIKKLASEMREEKSVSGKKLLRKIFFKNRNFMKAIYVVAKEKQQQENLEGLIELKFIRQLKTKEDRAQGLQKFIATMEAEIEASNSGNLFGTSSATDLTRTQQWLSLPLNIDQPVIREAKEMLSNRKTIDAIDLLTEKLERLVTENITERIFSTAKASK